MTLVVDASAIVPLALDDEDRGYAESVLNQIGVDGVAFTAPVFFDEVRNVLLVAERRGRSSEDANDRFLERLSTTLPVIEAPGLDRTVAMSIARRTGLSFYDASYLAAAVATGSAVATSDRRLADAARREGIMVYVSS